MRIPFAYTNILLALLLSPTAAAALQSDAAEPDEAAQQAIAKAIEDSEAFSKACSEAPKNTREADVAHYYKGRFSSATHSGMVAEYKGCDGRFAAFLSKREDGWQVDALHEVQAMPQCLRFRPKSQKDGKKARDVLVCTQTSRAEGGGADGKVVSFSVRDGELNKQVLTSFFSPLPCPSGRYRAVRPVEWRRWTYEGTDAPPRLGILLKTVDAEIPDEYMDACAAKTEAGFDPEADGNSQHLVITADLKSAGRKTPGFEPTTGVGDFCSKRNIRKVVSSKSDAIRYCYEQQLLDDPELEGKVKAQWKIQLDGSTSSVKITKSTLDSDQVEGCIKRVIDKMEFQKPDGGICLINYPFIFSPKEARDDEDDKDDSNEEEK